MVKVVTFIYRLTISLSLSHCLSYYAQLCRPYIHFQVNICAWENSCLTFFREIDVLTSGSDWQVCFLRFKQWCKVQQTLSLKSKGLVKKCDWISQWQFFYTMTAILPGRQSLFLKLYFLIQTTLHVILPSTQNHCQLSGSKVMVGLTLGTRSTPEESDSNRYKILEIPDFNFFQKPCFCAKSDLSQLRHGFSK